MDEETDEDSVPDGLESPRSGGSWNTIKKDEKSWIIAMW